MFKNKCSTISSVKHLATSVKKGTTRLDVFISTTGERKKTVRHIFLISYLFTENRIKHGRSNKQRRIIDRDHLITPRVDYPAILDLDAVKLFDRWIVDFWSLLTPTSQFSLTTNFSIAKALGS